MKIAFVLNSLLNGGPILVAHDLICELMNIGHQCEVFYIRDIKNLNFPCPCRKINFFSHVDFSRYDIIHCHGLRADLFMLLHKPFNIKIPVCTTIHSYLFEDHRYQFGILLSKITARFVLMSTIRDDMIITLSKHALNYYCKYLPKRKLTFAYNSRICDINQSIPQELFEKIMDFKGKKVLLGSNANLVPLKNLTAIVKSLPELPQVCFCIVGDGPDKENIISMSKQLKVDNRVLLLGRQPEAHRFNKLYDIFVMPSKVEGFPLAVLEAALYGKAIACSNLPVFQEIFKSDEVVMFDNDDQSSITRALEYACSHYSELGSKSYQKYINCYSPRCFAERHLFIYKKLIDNVQK